MDKADCLSACPKAVRNLAWSIGSEAYAKEHSASFKGKFSQVRKMHAPVFVGQKFGVRRPGEDSVLFSFELPAIIQQWDNQRMIAKSDKNVGQYWMRLEFLNFSPQRCSMLLKTRVGKTTTRDGQELIDLLQSQSHQDEKVKVQHICSDCSVADQAKGPTKAEIDKCYKEIRAN